MSEYRHTMSAYFTAFRIFTKYAPDLTFPITAEHDQIWVHVDPLTMDQEDIDLLFSLGWNYADFEDGWTKHV